MLNYSINDVERFWFKVDIKSDEECWPWKAGKFSSGYGEIKIKGKNLKAHRVAWELLNGEIPEGKQCLHNCDNRSCCNPSHLYIGTQSDNNLDIQHRNSGHSGRLSKFKTEGVLEIRRMHKEGYSAYEIAVKFNSGERHIRKICKGEVGNHTIEKGI
ncbi:MAG: HNH endonuclease [Gammaproteobacteria bacterium]|nr:HNH endonuclease [Gammaproteobacteria bacterium]MBU2346575.1 HNH endonuclease [Gammaproteobacteria bacterium]MBU2395688.1 HNH endonuclease [Gammaproteobacteria bacterium]